MTIRDKTCIAGIGTTQFYRRGQSEPRTELELNIVLVEFPDAPGVRLVSNLVGVAQEDVRSGLEVELVWEQAAPGTVLPRFRLAQ